MFRRPPSRQALPVFFCLLVFIWTAAIGWRGYQRIFPEHDEVITFLAVQGNEAAYNAAVSVEVHADRSDLRPLWDSREPVSFRSIEQDLGNGDIHPPGYFYVLSKWLYATNTNLAFGIALNILFALLIAGAIGLVLHRTTPVKGAAAICAACLWLWLPATLETTLFVRQYMLTALMLMLTWLSWSEYLRRPGWQTLVWIVLLQAATLLVSYQSATVVCIANALAGALLVNSGQRRSAAWLIAGTVISVLLVLLANPHIAEEISRQQAQTHGDGISIVQRFKVAVDGLLQIPFYVTTSVAKSTRIIARLAGALGMLWLLMCWASRLAPA